MPPLKSTQNCVHRNMLRKRFHKAYYENEEIYGKRSNVEGVFSALKRTILAKIVSKNYMAKKREVAFKIVIYNMKKNLFQLFFLIEKSFEFNSVFVEKEIC